jgi:hypothetical protein
MQKATSQMIIYANILENYSGFKILFGGTAPE